MDKLSEPHIQEDPNAVSRKRDHVDLAFQSQISVPDTRFYYEPMLSPHPQKGSLKLIPFLGKILKVPIWVSSMTGGTEKARTINGNLARACKDFGMGMGLGSCRQLLYSDEHLADFDVRGIMGEEAPLFANLGIAQVEKLIAKKDFSLVRRLLDKLQADGLIIHVNPLQEWMQPEGDRFEKAPLETIQAALQLSDFPIIVKEVGQGFGYESLKALLQLPLAAIEFGAAGGTNFAKLELLRGSEKGRDLYNNLALVGHSAEDMVGMTNRILREIGDKIRCRQVIVSGGVKDFLDGFYYMNQLEVPAIYGQASGFLRHAQGSYADLEAYIEGQVRGLELAQAFLKVR